MSKMNVKKSILEIVEKNNLEILKIDLCNDEESFARFYGGERDESCKVYATLEDLDFEVESIFMHEEVQGTVYCRNKDTKEPVWIVSYGDERGSWWEVNRVPDFYKDNQNEQRKSYQYIKGARLLLSLNLFNIDYETIDNNLYEALKELED